VKLIFTMLASYPLAGVLKRLPDTEPWKKNLFLIAVSLFYLVGVFDLWHGIRTLFISAAGAYAIAKWIEGPYMPWIGFVFCMGHMLWSHLYRELFPVAGVVDVTGAQMVLVMKLTAFCWSVHDGRLPDDVRPCPQPPGRPDAEG
jgi:lysophospholipid acyltransferase